MKDEEENDEPKKKPYIMDPDHRLLLRQAKPLLNSRNASVGHHFEFVNLLIFLKNFAHTNDVKRCILPANN